MAPISLPRIAGVASLYAAVSTTKNKVLKSVDYRSCYNTLGAQICNSRNSPPCVLHNLVVVSYPDFEADTSHIYQSRFQIACQEAGLEAFRGTGKAASRAALDY
jgi:hypothetical protein